MARISITEELESIYDKWSQTGIVYGQTDCAMSVFKFISDAYFDDTLLRRWRGRYAGSMTAARLIKTHGGAEAFAGRQLESVGWRKTIEAKPGDVGIVRDGIGQDIMAVCIDTDRWASKAEYGVFVHSRPASVVWTKEDATCP